MNTRIAKWSEEDETKLRKLWANGVKVKTIADDLGSTPGAISSKVRRLKLKARERSQVQGTDYRMKSNKKKIIKAPLYTPIETHPLPGTTPVSLLDLKNNQCRWPFGHIPDTVFCGCLVEGGSPYCGEHNKIAFKTSRSRKSPAKLEEEIVKCDAPVEKDSAADEMPAY